MVALASLILCAAVSLGAVVAHAQDPVDAGRRDAGRLDAGRLDAGRADAGRADAGRPDAGRPDAGRPDAGRPDAGRPDAGRPDAGTDAGSDASAIDGGPDAGLTDAGLALDAGSEDLDAGITDLAEGDDDELSFVEAAVEITREPSTGQVIRTILGLMFLLALAWLGGLPRVRRLEERLGISQVVTSGLPFVGLGALMHAPGVDVLSEDVLSSLTPLLQFGLGWIGFHTGFQFEGRAMDEVPRGTGSVVVLLTSFPFVLISVLAGVLMMATGLGVTPEGFHDRDALITLARDAILLGLAGALSAPIAQGIAKVASRATQLASTVAVLDDVFGVAALAVLSAWLRPENESGWQLPGMGWLFVTLGMAATLGLVVHFALLTAESSGERSSLLLGSVAFTAGLAGYASISPLVVCFLAGVVLRNVPGGDKAALEASFTRLERPVYLLFLTIVGALWRIDDGRGWLLLAAFLIARVGGRWLGARSARQLPAANRPPSLDATPDHELVLAPMGQLAIALVVTAQTLYESPAIRATVTAVIGGSILSEIFCRIGARRSAAHPPPPPEEGPVTIVESILSPADDDAPKDATDEGPESDGGSERASSEPTLEPTSSDPDDGETS